MFVYGYIFSICQHTTSRLCPTNRDESIHLSEGEPLLVRCPGKSIGVIITGKGAGSWNVELQDNEGCTTSSKPGCNRYMRSDDSEFDRNLKMIDTKTLEYHDLRYSNYTTTTKIMNILFIAIENEGVWTGIGKAWTCITKDLYSLQFEKVVFWVHCSYSFNKCWLSHNTSFCLDFFLFLLRRQSNEGTSKSLILLREEGSQAISFLSSSRLFECNILFVYQFFWICLIL